MHAVPFRHGERISFSYLVSQKNTGDTATIEVLRNSETLKLEVKLDIDRRLIPAHNKGKPPSYYIIAGFLFSTVSVPYLRSEVRVLLPTALTSNICLYRCKSSFIILLFYLSPVWKRFRVPSSSQVVGQAAVWNAPVTG